MVWFKKLEHFVNFYLFSLKKKRKANFNPINLILIIF